MFTWTFSASTETSATTASLWALWTDVTTWPTWDHDLEWVKLDGPFIPGTRGTLKPKGWFVSQFCTTYVYEQRGFGDVTTMPFTTLTFDHLLEPLPNNRTRITHSVRAQGLLAPLLRFTLLPKLKKGLPQSLQNLATMAQTLDAK